VRPLAKGRTLAARYAKIHAVARECLLVLEAVKAELASWYVADL
jgi:hypothetical protein